MLSMEYMIQLASAFLGSMGFALLFHIRREKLLLASLGGLLTWGVYLAAGGLTGEDVPRFFLASVAAAIYAEVMARVVKCPATLFAVTAAIPLVPGGSLYKTMQYVMEQEFALCSVQGLNTMLLAMAIALGMLCPMSLFHFIRQAGPGLERRRRARGERG